MAITIEEQPNSPFLSLTESGFKYTRKLNVHGTLEPVAALPLLPIFGEQLIVDSVPLNAFVSNLDVVQSDEAIIAGKELLRATVIYSTPSQDESQAPKENVATWRVSGAGQTAHVETVLPGTKQNFFPNQPDGDPVDASYQGNAIRVTDDGVQGVDIIAPAATLTIEHWLPTATADAAFVDSILSIAASTNEEPFDGPWGNWLTDEALYVGPEISFVTPALVSIVHTFQLSKNIAFTFDIDCPDIPTIIAKNAHEFFWTITKPSCDPAAPKKIIQAAVISAHVAQVYPQNSFSVLNLPASFVGGTA